MNDNRRLLFNVLIADIRETKDVQWKVLTLVITLCVGAATAFRLTLQPLSNIYLNGFLGLGVIIIGGMCSWIIIDQHSRARESRQRLLDIETTISDEIDSTLFAGVDPDIAKKYVRFEYKLLVPLFQAMVVLFVSILTSMIILL